jgi:hypothetical protein
MRKRAIAASSMHPRRRSATRTLWHANGFPLTIEEQSGRSPKCAWRVPAFTKREKLGDELHEQQQTNGRNELHCPLVNRWRTPQLQLALPSFVLISQLPRLMYRAILCNSNTRNTLEPHAWRTSAGSPHPLGSSVAVAAVGAATERGAAAAVACAGAGAGADSAQTAPASSPLTANSILPSCCCRDTHAKKAGSGEGKLPPASNRAVTSCCRAACSCCPCPSSWLHSQASSGVLVSTATCRRPSPPLRHRRSAAALVMQPASMNVLWLAPAVDGA